MRRHTLTTKFKFSEFVYGLEPIKNMDLQKGLEVLALVISTQELHYMGEIEISI